MLENKQIALIVIIAAAILLFVSGKLDLGSGQKVGEETGDMTQQQADDMAAPAEEGYVPKIDGVAIEVLKAGSGAKVVKSGDTLNVHYVGTLQDGTVFDSSVARNSPFSFRIGQGRVIEGWEKGLMGMEVGEKRKLTISPEMGYGDQANGKIPANSTLIFEVELLDIR